MIIQRLSISILFCLMLTVTASAQKGGVTADDVMQWNIEDSIRQNHNMVSNSTTRSAESLLVNNSLPERPNSWLIAITTVGGILGETKFVAWLNSDNTFSCGNTEFHGISDPENTFAQVSSLVASEVPLQPLKQKGSSQSSGSAVCSDCSTEYLTIYQYVKRKLISNRFKTNDLSGNWSLIFERIKMSSLCGEKQN